jgi:hypothetical protein
MVQTEFLRVVYHHSVAVRPELVEGSVWFDKLTTNGGSGG